MVKTYIIFSSLVGMLIWLIVGFIAWIPILLVGTSNFCFEVIRSSLNGEQIDRDTIITLKNKIDIYPRGFKNFELIISSHSKHHDSN